MKSSSGGIHKALGIEPGAQEAQEALDRERPRTAKRVTTPACAPHHRQVSDPKKKEREREKKGIPTLNLYDTLT